MRVTISDLAARLGLAKSTVSIGLRGDRRLSTATRERIQQAAVEMGYRPDPNLASIASLRWRRGGHDTGIGVALLTDRREPAAGVRQNYLNGARDRLDSLGYHATVFDLADQPSIAATNRILVARGIRGLLIPPVYNSSIIEGLDLGCFALAASGVGHWIPPFATATIDVFAAVTAGIDAIAAQGYRRIGVALLRHEGTAPDDARRFGAVAHARDAHAAQGHEILFWQGHVQPPRTEIEDMVAWYRSTRPDAILALNDFAFNWLRRAEAPGLKQLGYAVLNRTGTASGFAGIDPQHRRIAETAAELLDQGIRLNRPGLPVDPPTVVLVPPRWVPDGSLPPFRPATRLRTVH